MNTSVKTRTLPQTVTRSVVTGLTVFCFGAGLTLWITAWPKLERSEALFNLAAVVVCVALPLWLANKCRTATEQQMFRGVLIAAVILGVICLYGVAAALGIVPAAPWSALG